LWQTGEEGSSFERMFSILGCMGAQLPLFGLETPRFDEGFSRLRRLQLDETSWVDHAPGWLLGHESLFRALREETSWRSETAPMFERVVQVPRLIATLPHDGPCPSVVTDMRQALVARYGSPFEHTSLALYRDGDDSVAMHGDRVVRELLTAQVATVSIGAPRRFLLRPVEKGVGHTLLLGWGDLLVMGGACQRLWRHGVPKARHASPRISIMFRTTQA
jgi:alkylated DNA repair dioxygenase AlkB